MPPVSHALSLRDALPIYTGRLAPPIIEFDADGNVVNSWGDLKQLDPRLHSCHVDKDNNIWIGAGDRVASNRSEEHTSELQSRTDLVCRLLLEKKKGKPWS